MTGAEPFPATRRDLALLRAVAQGRCEFGAGCEPLLLVDGFVFADTSAARRLVEAGLVEAPGQGADLPTLTAAGRRLVEDRPTG